MANGENERSSKIGIIIRNYFPIARVARCELTKAWSTRQHLLADQAAVQGFR